MTDPFDVLREPVVPVAPDPDFAATLRARLERALALPRGVTPVLDTEIPTDQPTPSQAAPGGTAAPSQPAPEEAAPDEAAPDEAAPGGTAAPGGSPVPVLIPYLAVPVGRGQDALDWYVTVLGARRVGEPILMPDGKLGHAELDLGGATVYLAEEFPDIGHVAAGPAGSPVGLWLRVPDAAEAARRAVDGGGTLRGAVSDHHGHRNAEIRDPFGHRWMLQTPLAAVPDAWRQGDVGYAWLTAPDPDRAAEFYAAVLGWQYSPGHAAGGRTVEGRAMPLGIGAGAPGLQVSYAVDDVAAAVARVRAAGGTATAPEDRPYGPASDGTDDQGVPFSLHRAGGPGRTPANGRTRGDLSYLTFEVVDSARTRAFLGAVLGLDFEPGRVEDGWAVPGVAPMAGLSGGHATATVVPMWRVDDVAAAVEQVRAQGGTSTDPESQPYGTTAECTDDQGVRFYLGDT
jgi:uncharacterized glyoxalase superfamily protein PhnB